MKQLILLLFTVTLLGCSQNKSENSESEKPKLPKDVTYEIISEEKNEALKKTNIRIKLNKKIDASLLKIIATELKSSRTKYEKLWIFYTVPDMRSGTWATTHFEPNLTVEIIGSTPEQDKKMESLMIVEGDILGKWKNEKSLSGALMILYRNKGGNLIMRIVFKDGQNMEDVITESKLKNRVCYKDGNSHGEYYLLEEGGDLGMYGENGKFDEAKKIE